MPTLAEPQARERTVRVSPGRASVLNVATRCATTENGEEQATTGDWLVLTLMIASIALIVAMNVYDFLRGLLGF